MAKETNGLAKEDPKKGKRLKYDARGVQTLFRTLSRNHYNLLKMADNKARIVLTVNSIITSLLLGIRFIDAGTRGININTGTKILIISSMLSMIFALICILPHRYFGKKYRKSGYKGSLYAENFSSLSLDEFKQEFERIMLSGQSVYDEMVTDLYFLGKIISMKQKLVTISVGIFLLGLIATIIYTLSTTI